MALPLPYVETGGVCLDFELFLVGGSGLKFYSYAPDYSVRHVAAGGRSPISLALPLLYVETGGVCLDFELFLVGDQV